MSECEVILDQYDHYPVKLISGVRMVRISAASYHSILVLMSSYRSSQNILCTTVQSIPGKFWPRLTNIVLDFPNLSLMFFEAILVVRVDMIYVYMYV